MRDPLLMGTVAQATIAPANRRMDVERRIRLATSCVAILRRGPCGDHISQQRLVRQHPGVCLSTLLQRMPRSSAVSLPDLDKAMSRELVLTFGEGDVPKRFLVRSRRTFPAIR